MSSEYVGIEDARGRLGDLVTAAQQGIDTILTRNRRPVARISRYQEEDAMPVELIAPLSDEATLVLGHLVDITIEHEYGTDAPHELTGARTLAEAAVQMSVAAAYLAANNGDDRYLRGNVQTLVRQLVAQGLAERDGHDHIGRCTRHTEADVPELDDGRKLCGTCHVAEFNKTGQR